MKALLTAVAAAAAINAAAWTLPNRVADPADVRGSIEYLSYSPYTQGRSPKDQEAVPTEKIEADLSTIATVANGVRTYSVIDGVDQVPAIASKLGLNVILGAWIGDTEARDKMELETVIGLARANRDVKAILVGNEVLLRGERSVEELVQLIQKAKKQVRIPVSTGEIWNYWLRHPELVKAVDFLAVHVLPYWEGVAPEDAVQYTFDRLDELKKAYPGKRIVLAEFGWPSQGYNNRDAVPGDLAQAKILRDFLAEADKRGIEYNLVEAFDQTWKTNEGSVGAYWGMFDDHRQLKFPLTGLIEKHDHYWKGALAIVLGALLTVVGLWQSRPTLGHALAFALVANAMGVGLATAVAYPFEHYLSVGIVIMWALGTLMLLPLTVITLAKVHELAEVLFGRRVRRLITPQTPRPATGAAPKVSIHIPAYREQPDMLIETLNSMARLDYPDYEVVVIVNNTPEAFYKASVAAHCRELGEKFKYLDVTCSGFKAGALNIALEHTAPEAEVIAVVDADYVVERGWLKDLVPYFANPRVGLVQGPQDHRDGVQTPLKRMMNAEYAGFFDIGMVQRNEDDAIIQHGTMCLVRRSALEQLGGWAVDTIVEDTELGLRLYEAGYTALYTNTRYGRGLLPDTFQAFKTQRFRWAYGAMQIIRKHWPHILPGARTLTPAQKFHFVAGWSLWLSDALGALMSILNLLWVPVIILVGVIIPTLSFTIPILAAFVVNLLHCVLLYRKRVVLPLREVPGAAIAAMSLQLTVAKAVMVGLIRDSLPFKRTEKGGAAKRGAENPALWEMMIGGLLLVAAVVLIVLNQKERITEMTVFATTLAIQSLPFLAAGIMVSMEKRQTRVRRAKQARVPALANMALEPQAE